MKVRVRLFAAARELAGADVLVVEAAAGCTVADVRAALVERAPALTPLIERSLVAVNSEYAAVDAVVSDADEVALIPPVSGG